MPVFLLGSKLEAKCDVAGATGIERLNLNRKRNQKVEKMSIRYEKKTRVHDILLHQKLFQKFFLSGMSEKNLKL